MEINNEAIKKYLFVLGAREEYCIFGGQVEWNDSTRSYQIPRISPRKRTEWVVRDSVERKLEEYIKRGWSVWVSLNKKEIGEDSIEGTSCVSVFWFDIDAKREDNTRPASESERAAALREAEKFKAFMEERGWRGVIACSGNGYHLFYPLRGFNLPGKEFRKEFNQKQRLFYQKLRRESGVEIDTTSDIRRVTQPIGCPNMKIPGNPLGTYWVDEFDSGGVGEMRSSNESLFLAVLNTPLHVEQAHQPAGIEHKGFSELLKENEKLKDLYEGRWVQYGYKSRSEAEEAVVVYLCAKGFTDEEIKKIMKGCAIGKWQEKEESYYDITIKNAREYLKYGVTEKREEEGKREKLMRIDKSVILEDLFQRFIFITAEDTDEIYVYDKGMYKDGESLIKEEIEKMLGDRATSFLVSEILNHIRRRTYVPRGLFNADKKFIPVKNGLLNLETCKLEDFDSSKIFTSKLPVNFDPSVDCPKIIEFMHEVMNDGDIDCVQEFLGYTLYPDMPAHKTLWLYGSGRNGKTVFINLLRALLGNKQVVSIPLEELDGEHRFAEARLFGKLANITSEPATGRVMHTAIFKKLIGGDLISAEVKNKQKTIDFVNFAKFIIAGNSFPYVRDITRAFWERIIIVEFPNTFIENAVPNYERELIKIDGLSGFLNWCLVGLERLRENNFNFSISKVSEQVRTEFMKLSNSVQAFVDERCLIDSVSLISKSELYEAYKEYCVKEGIAIVGKREVTKVLTRLRGVTETTQVINGRLQRSWRGIKAKPTLRTLILDLVIQFEREDSRGVLYDVLVKRVEGDEDDIREEIDKMIQDGDLVVNRDEMGFLYLVRG